MTDLFSLEGRVAWVTGAGRGLGRAIAGGLGHAGAKLAVTSRTEAELRSLASELEGVTEVVVVPASVDDRAQIRAAADRVEARLGVPDVLVNCAGISPSYRRALDLPDDEWDRVLAENLTGAYTCATQIGRRMVERGSGSIVNVTSVHGAVAAERLVAYAASKGGLEMVTRSLAVEWAASGVRVNALAPGYFRTPLSDGVLSSRHGERIRAQIPLERYGDRAELVGAALFLASDASSYVTGTTLFVDGGWTAR